MMISCFIYKFSSISLLLSLGLPPRVYGAIGYILTQVVDWIVDGHAQLYGLWDWQM